MNPKNIRNCDISLGRKAALLSSICRIPLTSVTISAPLRTYKRSQLENFAIGETNPENRKKDRTQNLEIETQVVLESQENRERKKPRIAKKENDKDT